MTQLKFEPKSAVILATTLPQCSKELAGSYGVPALSWHSPLEQFWIVFNTWSHHLLFTWLQNRPSKTYSSCSLWSSLHPHFFCEWGKMHTLIYGYNTFPLSLTNCYYNENLPDLFINVQIFISLKSMSLSCWKTIDDSPVLLKLSWLLEHIESRKRPQRSCIPNSGEAISNSVISYVRADYQGEEGTSCNTTSNRFSGFHFVWFWALSQDFYFSLV